MDEQRLLTVLQTAERLNLGRSLTYRLVLAGDIASIKIGKSRRVPVDAIEEFIAGRLDAIDNTPILA